MVGHKDSPLYKAYRKFLFRDIKDKIPYGSKLPKDYIKKRAELWREMIRTGKIDYEKLSIAKTKNNYRKNKKGEWVKYRFGRKGRKRGPKSKANKERLAKKKGGYEHGLRFIRKKTQDNRE